MSTYTFNKEDFDRLDNIYVLAVEVEGTGTVAAYERIDQQRKTYREIEVVDSAIVDGILTLIAKRPFNGRAVVVKGGSLLDMPDKNSAANTKIVPIGDASTEQ